MRKYFLLFYFLLLFIACSKSKEHKLVIKSDFLPHSDTVLVFKPESYNNKKTYPLVILLHGWNASYNEWNSIANLQLYANAYNFIIACPDGFKDSWYLNSTININLQYENYFTNEFVPYLKNKFSLDTNNFFITGLSMGGHGAITLFIKNEELFKSAGSTSGILDITNFPNSWNIKSRIGNYEIFKNNWQDNSAFYLLDSLDNFEKKIIIDCGTEDFAYKVNLDFAKKCYDLGINIKFLSIEGAHNGNHWHKMIAKHFEFFRKQL